MRSSRTEAGFMQQRIRAAVILVVGLLAASLAAQQLGSAPTAADPPAQTPVAQTPAQVPPTFRGGINYVRVYVIVTAKKAQPVTDLKQSEFEVLEDGKPQQVDSFKLIRV